MGVREQDRHGSDFPPETDAAERARFHAGEHVAAWELLGAHPRQRSGVDGYRFCVWAPHAQSVSVVGDFNGWDAGHDPLHRHDDGIWEGFVPGARARQHYKFDLIDGSGHRRLKTDPFARASEYRPATASLTIADSTFEWTDGDWLAQRPDWLHAPLSIYEVHAGSWQRGSDGRFLGYREIGERLGDYVSDLGFTHVEFMPLLEHPFDGSWGYQPTGWFSPTRRFGEPDDLRAMIDHLHARGIGVILDWVPGHFPRDEHGLALFDGTPLFEPADSRRADMPDWGTLAFDHGRPEVRSFLISSALYWLREFHIDGLRVDAVASMIYLDYGRGPGGWQPNRHGGRENLEAEAFLQQFNSATHGQSPGSFTIAEESTAWPGVTRPTHTGGLGFSMKWNMGWMHDSLDYMKHEPVHRTWHHRELTFSLVYAFAENHVLPLSHDEVVHMKGSLLGRMPGDDWQRFANLRLLLCWQFTHPGRKLLFMGGEFGQPGEWNHDADLDWGCLDDPAHAGIHTLVRDLNGLYRDHLALHAGDFAHHGFAWIDCDDAEHALIAFRRIEGEQEVVVVVNFTPEVRGDFRLGLPHKGRWREALNSDSTLYGGSDVGNLGVIDAWAAPWMDQPASAVVVLPPLAALILVPDDDGGGDDDG